MRTKNVVFHSESCFRISSLLADQTPNRVETNSSSHPRVFFRNQSFLSEIQPQPQNAAIKLVTFVYLLRQTLVMINKGVSQNFLGKHGGSISIWKGRCSKILKKLNV